MSGFDPSIGLVEQIAEVICRRLYLTPGVEDAFKRMDAEDAAREIVERLDPTAVWQARRSADGQ